MIASASNTIGKNIPIILAYISQEHTVQEYVQEITGSTARVSISITIAAQHETVAQRFHSLAQKWRDETGGLSSPSGKLLNMNYLEILRLEAVTVVPLILRELEIRPDDWFLALRLLTRENAVKPEDVSDFGKVRQSWLEWGRNKRLI